MLLLFGFVVVSLVWILLSAVHGEGAANFVFPLLVLGVVLPLRYLFRRGRVEDRRDGRALFEIDLDHGESSKQLDDEAVDRAESDD